MGAAADGAARNLLATRTRRSSILTLPPTWSVNRMVLPAAVLALCIGIFFSYIPALYVVRPCFRA
jgi:sodium/potassium-transporting ATPase subunit alpha